MKKTILLSTVFLAGILVFSSCKKETSGDSSTPPTPTPKNTVAVMGSLKGSWVSSGTSLSPGDQTSYSEITLTVKADSTCSWLKKGKSVSTEDLLMEGKLQLEASGVKDASGKLIDRLWFAFNKINGQSFSGTLHGIYQVDDKNLTIDWYFMEPGTAYPDASKGFGSGQDGQKSIEKYTLK